MAHYAFLDENNIVTEVIVGVSENELIEGLDSETWYGNFRNQVCKRTSYNTRHNTHIQGGSPFRGNYASIGMFYDKTNDVFYEQQPFVSWTLDKKTWTWKPPIPDPSDNVNHYIWNEGNQAWEPVT